MSDPETKARIVSFLAKQRDWYNFNERQKLNTPGFDQAIAELLAEEQIAQLVVNDRPYYRVAGMAPPMHPRLRSD